MLAPLRYAVQHQLPKVVQELSRREVINPNIQNGEGKNPFHLAEALNNQELNDTLLSISQFAINVENTIYHIPLTIEINIHNNSFVEALLNK